jgi:hypothetical protein
MLAGSSPPPVLTPATITAPGAIPRGTLMKIRLSACLVGGAYFFLASTGLSNIFNKDSSYGFGLILFFAIFSAASFAYVCNIGFQHTRAIKLRTAVTSPYLIPWTLLSFFGASNFYTGAWLAATKIFKLSSLTAECIAAYCLISRYFLLIRSCISLMGIAHEWPQKWRDQNVKELLKIAYAFIIAIFGSVVSADSYYTAPAHPLLDYLNTSKNIIQIISPLWTTLSIIGFLPFYLFWAFFTLNLALKRNLCTLTQATIIDLAMFAAPIIGAATSDTTPVYGLLMKPKDILIFKLVVSLIATLAGTLIGALSIYDSLKNNLPCCRRSGIARVFLTEPPTTPTSVDDSATTPPVRVIVPEP